MEPIVLIHGYSAESKDTTPAGIAAIYGKLPQSLKQIYGANSVVEINLGRYISLTTGDYRFKNSVIGDHGISDLQKVSVQIQRPI